MTALASESLHAYAIKLFSSTDEYAPRHGHAFGYAVCQWIRSCDADVEWPGSRCNNSQSNVFLQGVCFTSDLNTLECGRLTEVSDSHGSNSRTFHHSTPALRCPVGSPARSLGTFVSKRPLAAGCMLSSDMKYDSFAEIHVPAYCNTSLNASVGCLMAGADNYDPFANQVGPCSFPTAGCMSATALNFNPHASLDDGSCIEPVKGCTMRPSSYDGVNAATPEYKSGYHGSALRSIGVVFENTYNDSVVLDFNPAANVFTRCTVAIEGCMESSAVNYDLEANVNSYSWCIPAVRGCMMPTSGNANVGYLNPSSSQIDGLSMNFDASVTVHDPELCVVTRIGCKAPPLNLPGFGDPVFALNYDSFATVHLNGSCAFPVTGCLNRAAMNFNCRTSDARSRCFASDVNLHDVSVCTFPWELTEPSPPTPPPPVAPEDGGAHVEVVTHQVEVSFIAEGSTEAFLGREAETISAYVGLICASTTEDCPISEADTVLTVIASSVKLTFTSNVASESAAQTAQATVTTSLGSSAAELQSSLGDTLGLTVLSAPDVNAKVAITYEPYNPPFPVLMVAGVSLSCTIFLCIAVLCIIFAYLRPKPMVVGAVYMAEAQDAEGIGTTSETRSRVAAPSEPAFSTSLPSPEAGGAPWRPPSGKQQVATGSSNDLLSRVVEKTMPPSNSSSKPAFHPPPQCSNSSSDTLSGAGVLAGVLGTEL